jgi:hypothetical protein
MQINRIFTHGMAWKEIAHFRRHITHDSSSDIDAIGSMVALNPLVLSRIHTYFEKRLLTFWPCPQGITLFVRAYTILLISFLQMAHIKQNMQTLPGVGRHLKFHEPRGFSMEQWDFYLVVNTISHHVFFSLEPECGIMQCFCCGANRQRI